MPFTLLALSALISPVAAQHYTVLGGTGTVQRQGRTYTLVRNSRLYEGDLIRSNQLQFCADYCAGVGTMRGIMQLLLIRREGGAIRNVISYTNFLSFVSRPFSNPRSRIQFLDAATGVAFSYPPKSRQSATAILPPERQTIQFEAASDQAKTYLAVRQGRLEVESAGSANQIGAGFGSVTPAQAPPGEAIALGPLEIQNLRYRVGNLGIWIFGQKNPLYRVQVQGKAVKAVLSGSQFFNLVKFPTVGNQIQVLIESPFGGQRVYWVKYFRHR